MTYYNQPKHGEQTQHGIWFDNRPLDENSTLDEMLAAAHTPDCDELECKHYNPFNFTLQERTWGELTYHAEHGLWLCEVHWAEIEAEATTTPPPMHTYEPPRLTPYGDLRELQGRGLG